MTQRVYLPEIRMMVNGNMADKVTELVIFGEKVDRKLTKNVKYLISSRKEY
jgi:hypothetical protein